MTIFAQIVNRVEKASFPVDLAIGAVFHYSDRGLTRSAGSGPAMWSSGELLNVGASYLFSRDIFQPLIFGLVAAVLPIRKWSPPFSLNEKNRDHASVVRTLGR